MNDLSKAINDVAKSNDIIISGPKLQATVNQIMLSVNSNTSTSIPRSNIRQALLLSHKELTNIIDPNPISNQILIQLEDNKNAVLSKKEVYQAISQVA
jgi:hypothetical protein